MRIEIIGLALVVGCGGGKLDEEEFAAQTYENLEPTLVRIIEAGLLAKDQSTNGANIDPVLLEGDEGGELELDGTIAQSAGENQQLSLTVQLTEYSDTGELVFDSFDGEPLDYSLGITNTPQDNQMSGSLVGDLAVSGELEGEAALDLSMNTDLTDDDADPQIICTRITGTVDDVDNDRGDPESVDIVVAGAGVELTEEEQAACAEL